MIDTRLIGQNRLSDVYETIFDLFIYIYIIKSTIYICDNCYFMVIPALICCS